MKALQNLIASLPGKTITLATVFGMAATVSIQSQAAPPLKQGIGPEYVSAVREEMVAGFIVKPHHRRGAKLVAALKNYDASALSEKSELSMTVARSMSNDAHVLRVEEPIPLSEAKAIAARMMRDGEVELAEPDRIIYPAATTPIDPSYGYYQWHYKAPAAQHRGSANFPPAWDYALGNGVTVAVLDTGYRPHADFNANILPGYDFITNTSTSNDGNRRDGDARDPGDWAGANVCGSEPAHNSSWHGTHVIGTIAALMNNGKGGTGVAPNAKILPLRVLGRCGGATSDIVDAMRWAAGIAVPGMPDNPNPAKVLNMSLGGSGSCSASFQSAVNDVVNVGKLVVVSTGNDTSATLTQPANCNGVLAVTAHAADGDNAHYSNIGSKTFISAPGGGCGANSFGSCTDFVSPEGLGIYSTGNAGSTTPGGDTYTLMMGTSMAAPHVTGTIALLLSLRPDLTPAEIKSVLRSTARPHPAGSFCTEDGYVDKCGAGLLDAGAALAAVGTGMGYPVANIVNVEQITTPNRTITLSGRAAPGTLSANAANFTYYWAASPSNPVPVTLQNANQPVASFTAPEKAGEYAFKLTVTDGDGKVGFAMATVVVNHAPQIKNIEDQSVVAGKSLTLSLEAEDPDGNPLIYHALSLPSGARISADGTFTWSSATPAGTHEVRYYASDAYSDSGEGTVTIHVAPSSDGGGGGGGGSMDDGSLIGLVLLSFYLRMRRASQAGAGGKH
ncbi:MAG: S8 family serine peptidase [Burkholderiaceae bacterium]